jgi:hypothetical protein
LGEDPLSYIKNRIANDRAEDSAFRAAYDEEAEQIAIAAEGRPDERLATKGARKNPSGKAVKGRSKP